MKAIISLFLAISTVAYSGPFDFLKSDSSKLHDAIKKGDIAKIRPLLEDLKLSDSDPSLLIMAAKECNKAMIEYFIKTNSIPAGQFQAIHQAAVNCDPEILELLRLENNANVDALDDKGKTPLMYALEKNPHTQTIEWLLVNGASANRKDKDGLTVLFYAISNSDPKKSDEYQKLLKEFKRLPRISNK